ncbi:Pentatricopeptide repeat-containing protein [Vitis vinifera]|uniref:Pentatricopeptide repeat-containing protein n=1 Tax=Vitis vinifera TaxID=29760 RepID=A0A438KMC5_VITVI|nr:Pentatricopeptide repeat-containing protein [Vitis vinifera]
MRGPNPSSNHPTLQLLEKCKTLDTLKQVHAHMITTGLIFHTYPLSRILLISSTIVFTHALSIFNHIPNPTIFLYNTLISSLANIKPHTHIAFSLYSRVLTHTTLKPNGFTFPSLFKACGSQPWLRHGRALHTHVLKFLEPTCDPFVQAALLNYYAKCGKDVSLSLEVLTLFIEMQKSLIKANEVTLVALISACAELGALSQENDTEGLAPDDVTLVVTMCSCSHVGLVEEGCDVFESMKEVYGVEPKLEHYGCLVDLLGRAGRLREAEERVLNMPMKPNAVIWRSLLGAARVHGNLEIGEVVLKHLIQLEPETSGNYVLLSNMYASINRWDDVKRVRKLMKDHGINKVPGSSLVEVGGAMHEFLMGDKTHPRSKEIYLKLEEMSRRLHEYGHKPRTLEVLFDIEEEEKEDALSYHSERLAIAFALIASHPCAPIRIIKNLRVCGDCHTSSKLISKIYEREIIVRDRNRFHHFKEGACSCSDYW